MKMRTEKQIYDTILNFAKADDRIRVVTLEGSRTNINITLNKLLARWGVRGESPLLDHIILVVTC